LRECRVIIGPSIDTTHNPPLLSFYTTFKNFVIWNFMFRKIVLVPRMCKFDKFIIIALLFLTSSKYNTNKSSFILDLSPSSLIPNPRHTPPLPLFIFMFVCYLILFPHMILSLILLILSLILHIIFFLILHPFSLAFSLLSSTHPLSHIFHLSHSRPSSYSFSITSSLSFLSNPPSDTLLDPSSAV